MPMKVAEKQKSVGQSVWIAHLSRPAVGGEALRKFISDWSITGMSLSPLAICRAMCDTDAYDYAIAKKLAEGLYGPPLFNRLILEDGRRAADLLRPVHDSSEGLDGWAVMPVSPLFHNECNSLAAKYKQIWDQIGRPNVLLLLQALPDHLVEVEELVCAGIPINIANVYSADQFTAVAQACLAGIKRRHIAGQPLTTSIFISVEIGRLIMALQEKVIHQWARTLVLAIARKIYRALRDFYDSPEWDWMVKADRLPLRLVWALSADLDKSEVDSGLTGSLIAPCTTVSLPQTMITGIDAHHDDDPMPADGGDCDRVLTNFALAGLDVGAEADKLQLGHFDRLSKQWAILLESVARKSSGMCPVRSLN